jgi:hypothetical protein
MRVETSRLNWMKHNQHQLRVDSYAGLMDYLNKRKGDETVVGKMVILPSTFVGSDRYFLQNYNDAMAIVGEFGKPDFFITFTCNSMWPEITAALLTNQSPCDRPDIVFRVFNLKFRHLLHKTIIP